MSKVYFANYKEKNTEVVVRSNLFDSSNFRIGIGINDWYFVIIPKTEKAKMKFDRWYMGHIREHGVPTPNEKFIKTLDAFTSNEKEFELIEDQRKAYVDFLILRGTVKQTTPEGLADSGWYPAKPDKDFQLLKDWFYKVLEINEAEFSKESIGNSNEEIEYAKQVFIQSQIQDAEQKIKDKTISFKVKNTNGTYLRFLKSVIDNKGEVDETLPNEVQQRIAWLYAIGVIDFIGKQAGTDSSSSIANILKESIKVKQNAIRMAIDRLRAGNALQKYNSYINQTCKRLKVERTVK